ncbi:MAG: hypothetical protein RLZZ84_804 [Pseudomonadota bacterium]|jgi:predicted Zn finger-like uncharacterized protein
MFNAQTMLIACPACGTRYVVPDSAIGVDGRTVRCAKCRNSWFQDGPQLAPPPVAPPAAPVHPHPAAQASDAPPAAAPLPTEQASAQASAQAEPAPIPALADTDNAPPPPVYADPNWADDDDRSSFAHEPPFRPRRNPARMWTFAAAIFAIVALGAVGATAWYGLPDWLPFARPLFAESQPGLKLDFPAKQQDRHELADHTWFFNANGVVTNVSATPRSVPSILIVLRDAGGRIVYTAEVQSPKRVLAPGESVAINEALTMVPKSGVRAEFGWKPGT